jgi:hypothetical protein
MNSREFLEEIAFSEGLAKDPTHPGRRVLINHMLSEGHISFDTYVICLLLNDIAVSLNKPSE